ncbi:MAG: hypothetical protein ACM3XO_00080 [Bacteroidota bacterium]
MTTTKAIPVSAGTESKNIPSAFSPPAEAPMPTIVKSVLLFNGSTGAGASASRGFFVDFGGDFGDCCIFFFLLFFSAIETLWLLPFPISD